MSTSFGNIDIYNQARNTHNIHCIVDETWNLMKMVLKNDVNKKPTWGNGFEMKFHKERKTTLNKMKKRGVRKW